VKAAGEAGVDSVVEMEVFMASVEAGSGAGGSAASAEEADAEHPTFTVNFIHRRSKERSGI
jgi:hypothetical protein